MGLTLIQMVIVEPPRIRDCRFLSCLCVSEQGPLHTRGCPRRTLASVQRLRAPCAHGAVLGAELVCNTGVGAPISAISSNISSPRVRMRMVRHSDSEGCFFPPHRGGFCCLAVLASCSESLRTPGGSTSPTRRSARSFSPRTDAGQNRSASAQCFTSPLRTRGCRVLRKLALRVDSVSPAHTGLPAPLR